MPNDKSKNYVNRRERIGGLVYVLAIFCAGSGVLFWLVISQSNISEVFSRRNSVQLKLERQHNFRRIQQDKLPLCEELQQRILSYDPGVNAVYEKNDIQYMINDLRRGYEENRQDKRYVTFLHMADFYQMWFNDRQHLWSLSSNLDYLRQNLEDCELGLEKKLKAGN
ncbi:MAG: type VI secretion system transmembrane protein TssO [Rikenellaceae bacterium]|nr:type VI secretion system transmembrane protein TssO [Rikenellaceae bacterium]